MRREILSLDAIVKANSVAVSRYCLAQKNPTNVYQRIERSNAFLTGSTILRNPTSGICLVSTP